MIIDYKGISPKLEDDVFVAQNAAIIGDTRLSSDVNIWFGAVLRADISPILIGKGTNVQDNSTLHGDTNHPVEIGERVTIGHNCVIHGCSIQDEVLIGMGSTILNGAQIGSHTIIGAGSLVTQNKVIPSGVLCMGSPARVVRALTEKEIESIKKSSETYITLTKNYK